MASNVPPMPPAPEAGPVKKKTSPWVWVAAGCGGLILIVVLVIGIAGTYFYGQVKKNPALATAKLMIAANPKLEIAGSDDARGTVTIREKETGKTVTVNLQDLQKGKISFEGEAGEKVSIGSTGETAKLPSWIPNYPGSSPRSTFASSDNTSENGGFSFETKDDPAAVIKFYDEKFKENGLTVSTLGQDKGGVLNATDEGNQREATITISASDSGTSVIGAFKSKK